MPLLSCLSCHASLVFHLPVHCFFSTPTCASSNTCMHLATCLPIYFLFLSLCLGDGTVFYSLSPTPHDIEKSDTPESELEFQQGAECSTCNTEFSFFLLCYHCTNCKRSFCGDHCKAVSVSMVAEEEQSDSIFGAPDIRMCGDCVMITRHKRRRATALHGSTGSKLSGSAARVRSKSTSQKLKKRNSVDLGWLTFEVEADDGSENENENENDKSGGSDNGSDSDGSVDSHESETDTERSRPASVASSQQDQDQQQGRLLLPGGQQQQQGQLQLPEGEKAEKTPERAKQEDSDNNTSEITETETEIITEADDGESSPIRLKAEAMLKSFGTITKSSKKIGNCKVINYKVIQEKQRSSLLRSFSLV